ncbi:class I SAM-dependent methyltransferase [Dyadobacter arcticus]|uniref:Cephalosporin hydroxylase n=1 Tax=Dyadobacter arcticus TaxID=1078754 RepID=A0ABX0UMH7_9BACT|nr:class I SAM-dependent methyltransferase [Dyadobacter arcticus]NIJ54161.1 cephalosporin hydroxylase [Dyadobacter arcticus]
MTIRELFYNHEGNLIHKWDHYFDIYEKHFAKYRGQKVNMLEIGISHGGSMQLWKKYFGDHAHIYAIDINPDCKKLEEENTTIFIGSQSDKGFLERVSKELPELDIIIDDGGHTMNQQLTSFEALYLKVKEGGLYIVEDTHTSYWTEFYGGLKTPGTFIEHAKHLVDTLYESHIHEKDAIAFDEITRHIYSITFYDSVVVFEKELRKKPFHKQVGNMTIIPYVPEELKKETFWDSIRNYFNPKTKHSFEENDGGFV